MPSRGRPFPHPADPHHRGRADRPRARPRASRSTRISPRRWRSATISATRRSATPARTRSTPAWPRYGGFDHNSHGLRIVTELERRYAEFDGLNLTWETLEGLVKHNGPLLDAAGRADCALARARRSGGDPRLRSRSSICASRISGARGASGGARRRHRLQRPRHRRRLARRAVRARRLAGVPFLGGLIAEIEARCIPGSSEPRAIHELVAARHHPLRRGRDRRDAARGSPSGRSRPPPTRGARRGRCSPSPPAMAAAERDIKAFLFARMYRHPQVNADARRGRRGSCASCSPPMSSRPAARCRPTGRRGPTRRSARGARASADYIAGMTDRFALDEHRRLFDPDDARCAKAPPSSQDN